MFEYNNCRLDITLMKSSYDFNDMEMLFTEPFSTLYPTKIGFEWQPSVVGESAISIELICKFVLTGATTVLISKITSDIYEWTKKSLKKVLEKKKGFEESRIELVFEDIVVTFYINGKDEILTVMQNLDIVFGYIGKHKGDNKYLDLSISDLNEVLNKK